MTLTFNKFPFLKELGLSEDNLGCYSNGKWVGNGQEVIAMNPATNEPIARIRCASLGDYNETIKSMESEKERWAKMPAP